MPTEVERDGEASGELLEEVPKDGDGEALAAPAADAVLVQVVEAKTAEGNEELTETKDEEFHDAADTPDELAQEPRQETSPQDAPPAATEETKVEDPAPPVATNVEPSLPNPTPEFYPPHSAMPPHPHQPPPLQVHPSHEAVANKKKKRQYIIKNPNRPKRPLSAYNIFFKYERERLVREEMLKDENADVVKVEELIAIRDRTKTGKRVHRKTHGAIAFADLGKLISKNWKALSDADRAKYETEAAIDKERYQRELEESHAAMAANEPPKPPPGPKIRNKRLGDAPMDDREGKRIKPIGPYDGPLGYDGPGHYPPGPSPRGPPAYYDPYFGYGRPPPLHSGGENYGPPPGYGPPPHHVPHGSGPPPPPGPYGYHYPPPPPDYYYGRPPPPLAPGAEGTAKDGMPQSFAPPYSYPYPSYPPRPPIPMQAPHDNGLPNSIPPSPRAWIPNDRPETEPPAECAYQCEVCNNAVFSTFKECADHEEECAKKHGTASNEGRSMPQHQENNQTKQHPSPATKRQEETEQRAAVEAVLLLKTGNEAVDV